MHDANQVLLVTGDESIASEVLRLAAAAGVHPAVTNAPAVALAQWGGGAAVLVGADLAGDCAALAPSRRDGVHVINRGASGTDVYAAGMALGAQGVIDLSLTPNWLLEILANLGETSAAPGIVVGVIGGCGGAGASVFATALAMSRSWSQPTLLIDADQVGVGLDRILGRETLPGPRWDALAESSGRLSGWSLRESLPSLDDLSLLTFAAGAVTDLDGGLIRRVLEAGRRGFTMIVVDLPRRLDPMVHETLARLDHLIVVAPMTFSAVASSTRLCQRLPDASLPRHLVARGSGLVVPSEAARTMRIPLLAAMNSQRGLDEDIYLGAGPLRRPRGPLGRTAMAVAATLSRPEPVRSV